MTHLDVVLSAADVKALQAVTRQRNPKRSLMAWVGRARRWRKAREQVLGAYQPSPRITDLVLVAAAEIDRNEQSIPAESASKSRRRTRDRR